MSEPAREHLPEVTYPDSDGRPMGETGRHGLALMDLVITLRARFADRPDVCVGGNQFMYWSEGDPSQVACPDVYVILGRPRDPPRDTLRVWDEGPPTFILELTSKSSRANDLGKRALYAALGVREYAMFDPLGDYLRPRLRLWRLPEPSEPADADAVDVDADVPDDLPEYAEVARGPHGLWSDVLGLWLAIDDEADRALVRLRERDGQSVLRPGERADAEATRADAEATRADAEAIRADAEAIRADAEAARAARAEAERDALLAEIARLRGG